MATPEVPPKSPFLSSLMNNAPPPTEPHPISQADPHSLSPAETETHSVSPAPDPVEKKTPKNHKVRPPIAPKPKGLLVKSLIRQRANTISFLSEREPEQWKPPVTPRKKRAAPPKPPRQSIVEIPEESDGEETERAMASNNTSSTDSEFCEEEYDLTPYQSSTDPTTIIIPSQPLNMPTLPHNKPAFRTLSHPQLHSPQTRGHFHMFDPILTPQLSHKKSDDVIDGYHKLQAKHLPLFKEMNLAELAKKYAKFFPIKIQITEGHYGMSSRYSISTDDRFNLHFKKRMKQVTIQTYGEEYVVPLSTCIQFGLVYDPSNNLSVALEGHRFRRVADLISSSPLPKVVRVMSACSCSNGVFLDYNELLVVRRVKTQLFRGKPMLKVFSLLNMTKKLLPEEAIGNFTTKPLCLKMDLTTILEHIRKPFPYKAMMYLNKEEDGVNGTDEEELPPKMFSWPVTVKEVKKQESLVATLEKSTQLIDIPVQGSIAAVKANIVPPNSPEDIHELFRNTRTFLHKFDFTRVDIYGDFNTESAYDAQNTLYKMVRGSVKGLGIEVVTPDALRKLRQFGLETFDADSFTSSTSGDPLYDRLPGGGDASEDEEYETLDRVRPTITTTGVDPIERQSVLIDRGFPIPTPRLKPPVSPRRRADTTFSGSGTFRFLRQPLSPPESTPLGKSHRSVSLVHLPPSPDTTTFEENRDYVKSLSIAQVCTRANIPVSLVSPLLLQVSLLLEDMNLGQYKQAFVEQQVSGDVLVDLTESMLSSKELGIESDLHRLRLMKVIRGEPSAHRQLKDSPSYCHLTRKPPT